MTETREDYKTKALTVAQPLSPGIWRMLTEVALSSFESRRFGITTAAESNIRTLFCYENGLPLTAANTGLYIVNGKMGMQGNIIGALLRRHPNYDYDVKELNDRGCTVVILRRDETGKMKPIGEATFNESHARRAGLINKDNWKKFPEDQYFYKALVRGQRRYAPDVFGGPVYTPDELEDIVDAEAWEIEKPPPTMNELIAEYGAKAVMDAGGLEPNADLAEIERKLKDERA